MSSDLILIYAAIAGVVLLGALVGLWWMNRDPHVERDASGVVPLFAGTTLPTEDAMAEGVMSGGAVRRQGTFDMRPAPPTPHASNGAALDLRAWNESSVVHEAAAGDGAAQSADLTSSYSPSASGASTATPRPSSPGDAWPTTPYRPPVIRSFTTAAPTRDAEIAPKANRRDAVPTDGALGEASVTADAHVDAAVERQLLRFSPPVEGTLQFLPGRLLVVSGQEAGRELRFVRLPGPNGTEITFGRNEGELYRHIQLRDQTVSRMHAALRFADGRWHLRNLSQTNPVMLDGLSVASGTEHALEDGARIEMGEVLFSFRNR